MKKLLLGLGTITAVAVPVVAIVSCADHHGKDFYKKVPKEISDDGKDHYFVAESHWSSNDSGTITIQYEITKAEYDKHKGGE